jgi:tetratricopeptide (TPR) repeat protein
MRAAPVSWILLPSVLAALAPGARAAAAPAPGDEEIRPFDRILLANGRELEGIIASPDAELAERIEIRTVEGAQITVPRSDVQSIVPRQTSEQVYGKVRQRVRLVREPEARSRAELELALWCKTPRPELGGAQPMAGAAAEHLRNALAANPALHDAYPHMIAVLAEKGDPADLGEADIEEELRVALLAEAGGYEDPELDFRLGVLFARQLADPDLAVRHLEKVVASGHDNRGQTRRARSLLADLYRRAGTPEKAFSLYRAILVEPETDPVNFEPLLELALLEMQKGASGFPAARALLLKAQAIQPEFSDILGHLGAMDYHEGNITGAEKHLRALLGRDQGSFEARLALSLVHARRGLYGQAEKELRALLGEAPPAERARIHLGLGSIAEARGQHDAALGQYREALSVEPGGPVSVEANLALGFLLARGGGGEEARRIAEELLKRYPDNLAIFAAGSRLLGEAALAGGQDGEAINHFEQAVEVEGRDPTQLEQAGILSLRAGRLDAGYELLSRVEKLGVEERPDTVNGLAYYYYQRGDRARAEELFRKVASRAVRDRRAAQETPQRAYARSGLDLLEDLESLEVWTADFAGPDGPTLNGWVETERFGVEISRKDGAIVLSGAQAKEPEGLTVVTLERPVEVRSFERIAATVGGLSGDVRVALRLEGHSATGASAGIVFYKDIDGLMRFQTKTTRGDWTHGEPTTAEAPKPAGSGGTEARGTQTKLVYPGTTRWPDGGGSHVLEIRRSREGRSSVRAAGASTPLRSRSTSSATRFDLLLDGAPVAENVDVTGLGGQTYEVGISGQTDAVEKSYTIVVEDFKVYRKRSRAEKRERR